MESVEMKKSSFYNDNSEKFDQEHYFSQQREQNEIRQEKIKQLFPPPQHAVLLEWKGLNLTVSTKSSSMFSRKKKKSKGGERGEKETSSLTKPEEKATRTILKNMSGSVAPGEFLAILGPSGAGKTSLLHALAGRIPLQKENKKKKKKEEEKVGLTGSILVNGVNRDETPIDKESCFVLQEDIFFGELTVRQTLKFTARLSMPKDISNKVKDQRAEDIIELLRLRKCANTCVGGILTRGVSGGEKKRLNIANELMSNATLVMMDEPTSGLDASTALLVVSLLSDLARSGKTVIATLHQPSSLMFHMFDKLLLLADGQPAFLGNAKDAVPYFSNLGFTCPDQFNPADYLLSILDEVPNSEGGEGGTNSTYRTAILNAYRKSREGSEEEEEVNESDKSDSLDEEAFPSVLQKEKKQLKNYEIPPPLPTNLNRGFQASYFTQMWLLALRGAKQHLIEAIPNLIVFIMMSILSSIAWWQLGYKEEDIGDRKGLLFFVVFNAFVLPMFSALSEVSQERVIVRKERPSHLYRLSAYILSKTIANAPIDALSPIIMSVIIYWTCNLNDKFDRFVIYCLASFCGQLSGMGVGIALGVNFDRPEKATPWVVFVFFLLSITGGFFIRIAALPSWFRWTQYLSLMKHWMDAVLVNEFDDKDHVFKAEGGSIITGKDFLKEQDLIFGYKLWPGLMILAGSYIAAQVLAYFLLRWHTQRKKG